MYGSCSTHGKDEKHKILVRKLTGKRPLGRYRHTWEDNIRMDLKRNSVERCGLDESHLR